MRESILQSKVMRYLRAKGIYARKLHDMYTAGLGDILVIIDGAAIFIELKSDTGKLSKIQAWEAARVREAGGIYCVCRTLEQVKEAVCGIERQG